MATLKNIVDQLNADTRLAAAEKNVQQFVEVSEYLQSVLALHGKTIAELATRFDEKLKILESALDCLAMRVIEIENGEDEYADE